MGLCQTCIWKGTEEDDVVRKERHDGERVMTILPRL